jgi:hypothetical protein
MATDKKSFVLYADLLATVSKLPDDKAGQLFKHILAYVNDQNPETDDILLQIAFEPIKQQLKRDLIKWEDKREVRAELGRIGGVKSGEARRSKMKQNEAKASNSKQNEANEAVTVNANVNVNANDTVNVTVIDSVPVRKTAFTKPTQEQVLEVIEDFVEAEKFFNYYESNGWRVGKNPMKNWKAAAAMWKSKIKNYATNWGTNTGSGQKLGTSAARIEALKRW